MKLKQVILMIAAGAIIIINPLSVQGQGGVGMEYLDKGNEYYKAGLFKQAVEKYKIAWEEDKLLDALANMAFVYDFQFNDNETALKYYNEYIAADTEYAEIDKFKELAKKAEQDLKTEKDWRRTLKQKEAEVKSTQEKYIKIAEPTAPPMLQKEGFDKGLSRACLACHAGFMGPKVDVMASHPVGRVPTGSLAETVPAEVRFYKQGEVICLSCHDPQNIHFEQGTPGRTYKLLRVDTGAEGEDMSRFCAMCHSDKSSSRFLEEAYDDEDGEIIRRIQ